MRGNSDFYVTTLLHWNFQTICFCLNGKSPLTSFYDSAKIRLSTL
jgi:hypothetical protein